MTLSVRSFGVIWIRISDSRSFGLWCIMNRWIRDQSGFISSFDAPWSEWPCITNPDPDNHKETHYLLISIKLCVIEPRGKIVNLIGLKIIINVSKYYSTYDSLKCSMCSDIVMRLYFFPKFFHLEPHGHLPQLNFSVFFIENTALWHLTCMYCPKLVIHSNQIKLQVWLLM